MSPLRIVHLVEAMGIGGLERMVQALVLQARSHGISAEVLCAVRGGPIAQEIESSGIRVRILGARGYWPRDIARAARALQEARPDVVHSHGHFAGVFGRAAARWAGVPLRVHHLHTIDTTLRERHLALERLLSRLTHRVVCCSNAVATHARSVLSTGEGLVTVVPNGIDPAPIASREAVLSKLGHPQAPILGCLGSLTPHKGQAILLRALDHLPQSLGRPTVVFLGEGPERKALERLAAEGSRGARAFFLGERLDARAWLPAFDMVVVPSIEREGFGLAALEALDAGVPVIASRVGGLPEVVDHERTGLLVPPGDPAALAAAIARLLERPQERRMLAEEGRRQVDRCFRASLMAERIEALYEEEIRVLRAA